MPRIKKRNLAIILIVLVIPVLFPGMVKAEPMHAGPLVFGPHGVASPQNSALPPATISNYPTEVPIPMMQFPPLVSYQFVPVQNLEIKPVNGMEGGHRQN